jgi:hypothetical protein
MKRLALLALSLALIGTGVHASNVPISQLPPGGNMLSGDLVPATRNGVTYGVVFEGAALSSLTNAVAANTITNAGFTQNWQWPTLGANMGLALSGITSGSGIALSVTTSGAGNTGYAGYFANTSTSGYALFVSGNLSTAGNTVLGPLTTAQGLSVTGNLLGTNAALSGTTTVNNLSITGTCVGCGGSIASQTVVSTGSSHTTSACNTFVGWNSASGLAKTENIPASTGSLCEITIADLFGDAGTNAITPVPAAGSILGSPTVYTSHGSITLLDTSAGWAGI